MSVATASAVLRVRLTSTISRALPRVRAAIAHAQPTLPAPIMPIFTDFSAVGLSTRRRSDRSRRHHASARAAQPRSARREYMSRCVGLVSLLCNAGRLEQEPDAPLAFVDPVLDQAGGRHILVLVAHRV